MDTTIDSSASAATGELLQLTHPRKKPKPVPATTRVLRSFFKKPNRPHTTQESTSEIATSPIRTDNKECSRVPVAMPSSDRLSQLPQEIRFRIYDFLFARPILHWNSWPPGHHYGWPPSGALDFPIKIMETNRLLHYEVEHYISNFAKVHLWYQSNGIESHRVKSIPKRYIRLINRMEARNDVFQLPHITADNLPNLREFIMCNRTKIIMLNGPYNKPRKFHNGIIEINGNQAAGCLEECIDIPHPDLRFRVPEYCFNGGINMIRYRFRIAFSKDHGKTSVHAIHNVEVSRKANGEQSLRLVAEVFEKPVDYYIEEIMTIRNEFRQRWLHTFKEERDRYYALLDRVQSSAAARVTS